MWRVQFVSQEVQKHVAVLKYYGSKVIVITLWVDRGVSMKLLKMVLRLILQRKKLFFAAGPILHFTVLYNDKHLDCAAWVGSSECSVLVSVHVSSSSAVKFTTHEQTQSSMDFILYVTRPLVQPAEMMLGIFDNLITHMLGAEASAVWFVRCGRGRLW